MDSSVDTPRKDYDKIYQARRRQFIIVVLAMHIPVFAYPVLRLSGWFGLSWLPTLLILVPVFFSQIFARVVLRNRTGKLVFALRSLADFLLGLAPLVLMTLVLFEILVAFGLMPGLVAAKSVVFITSLLALYGLYIVWDPKVVRVKLASDKLERPVRFVQISDVHIGSRSTRFLRHVMHKINHLDAEFLCITGDFIDQPGITAEQLKSLQEFDGPIYFTIGNHERYEDLDEIIARLESLGVNVLRNQSIMHREIQVIGIDDKDDPGQVRKQLEHIEVSKEHYSILLYHRPHGLKACDEHGIELMMSGHTHGGQIIPFNLAVNQVFRRSKGIYHLGNSTLHVSEGTGTWGPAMRLGTRSEITLYQLNE